jgi:DNA-binding transcriptional LysR family regulator
MMDLRQLTYFAAVAEELSFTRAASRLHISQPPLTRQIQALETDLGVQLFLRTSRGVKLTEAGESLVNDAGHIKALMEQATERAQLADKGNAGRLDVGVHGSAMLATLPRLFSTYTASHPMVKIVLHLGQTPSQVIALRQGRVSIVFERLLPDEPDIAVELVSREPVILVLPEHHLLAKSETVAIEQLRDEPMIIPSSPSRIANVGLQLCRAHGFEPKLAQQCADVMSGAVLAACGAGLFLAPASLAVVQMPGVVFRPVRSRVKAEMALHCYYMRDNLARSPLLQSMLDVVRQFRLHAVQG